MSELDSQINAVASQLTDLSAKVQDNDPLRKKLLGITMMTTGQLETPVETMFRQAFTLHTPAALMSLMKMGGAA